MAKSSFWDDLGNTLTRKAKGLSSRAENLYEIQKIRNKLSAQERMTEKLMMAIGKMFMGNDSDAKLARKFKSIRILDLEACSTSVKERFSKKINAQRIKDYETLVQVNDEGEKVHILAKSKNDVIRELLIVCTGNGDCTLVQLKGKVSKEKIAKLLAKEEMM